MDPSIADASPSNISPLSALLSGQPGGLFAVLDAGRDDDVLTLLHGCHDKTMRSLYDGQAERDLSAVGPMLVELPPHTPLLADLLRAGWGRGWGVFLSSDADFDGLRRHFRTLLMARRESDGKEVYFRFYDPRVLRAFLPTCTGGQVMEMFGPVRAFLVEAADPESMHCFTMGGGEVSVKMISWRGPDSGSEERA